MRLFKHRVPANDSKIHYAGARRCSLRAENFAKGILLSGLPLHVEQRRRTHTRPPVAPFLPGGRVWQRGFVGARFDYPARPEPRARFFLWSIFDCEEP